MRKTIKVTRVDAAALTSAILVTLIVFLIIITPYILT